MHRSRIHISLHETDAVNNRFRIKIKLAHLNREVVRKIEACSSFFFHFEENYNVRSNRDAVSMLRAIFASFKSVGAAKYA